MFRIYYYSCHILVINKFMEGNHSFLENRTLIISRNLEKVKLIALDFERLILQTYSRLLFAVYHSKNVDVIKCLIEWKRTSEL